MANFITNNILYSYNKMHIYFKEIMKTLITWNIIVSLNSITLA